MSADAEGAVWREPWEPYRDETSARYAEAELQRELCPAHALFGCDVQAIGRRGDRDDVLFRVAHPAAVYALVHLTFQRETEPRWPATEFFATWSEFVRRRLLPDATGYAA